VKRSLLYLSFFVVLSGIIGTLAARDPGLILIQYDGAMLQTSLWIMLIMLAVFALVIYWMVRLRYTVLGATASFANWGSERQRSKANRLTSRGLIYYLEGNFERAEKFLISGAKFHESATVNYIAAAKTAEARGDFEAREAYLRQAISLDSSVLQAVAKASAEMASERGDWQDCIDYLSESHDNPSTLALKKDALIHLGAWSALALLIPQLRKLGQDASLDELEKQILMHQLSEAGLDNQALLKLYKKGSDTVRRDEEIILTLCGAISNEKEIEITLRNELKRLWRGALVEAYGSVGNETLALRLKTAEGWQKSHADDPALQHCLGRLYEASGDREKAKKAYVSSLENGNNTGASRHLANLLAFDGDFEKSNKYLRLALGG